MPPVSGRRPASIDRVGPVPRVPVPDSCGDCGSPRSPQPPDRSDGTRRPRLFRTITEWRQPIYFADLLKSNPSRFLGVDVTSAFASPLTCPKSSRFAPYAEPLHHPKTGYLASLH